HRGEKVQACTNALPAEQHDAEETGFEEKRRQDLVGEQRSVDRAGDPGEAGPVGAELVGHHDAGDDAHAETDCENLRPEVKEFAINQLARSQPQALEHGEITREPDADRGEDDMGRNRERELQPREYQDVTRLGNQTCPPLARLYTSSWVPTSSAIRIICAMNSTARRSTPRWPPPNPTRCARTCSCSWRRRSPATLSCGATNSPRPGSRTNASCRGFAPGCSRNWLNDSARASCCRPLRRRSSPTATSTRARPMRMPSPRRSGVMRRSFKPWRPMPAAAERPAPTLPALNHGIAAHRETIFVPQFSARTTDWCRTSAWSWE